METIDVQNCYVCGEKGTPLYKGLRDRLYAAPGEWNDRICPKCGLLWLDPRPSDRSLGEAYETYYTHAGAQSSLSLARRLYKEIGDAYISRKYGYELKTGALAKALSWLLYLYPARKTDLEFNVFFLKSKRGARLLDVGCGGGIMMENMKRIGWETEGVDFDESAVRAANSRGLSAHIGRLEDQKINSDHFDAVTMSHVVEHLPDPLTTLKEAYRILKPGGELILITPNSLSMGRRLYGINWFPLDPPRHLYIFKPEILEEMAKRAGFSSVKTRTSIRGGAGIFVGSKDIRNTGRYDMDRRRGIFENLWARSMEYFEWILLKLNKDLGEEVVLVAVK